MSDNHFINSGIEGNDFRGMNFYRVDLQGARLQGGNFQGACLQEACLKYAYLKDADLQGVNLRDACLKQADFKDTDLRDACLQGADLRGADLRGAYLQCADLQGADLSGAYLQGADLSGVSINYAIFYGANLRGAKIDANLAAALMACPSEGAFIGWKFASGHIIKLMIPEDAKRSSATTRKCRCDKALVVEIFNKFGDETPDDVVVHKYYNNSENLITVYQKGMMVYPDSFDDDRWNECSHGIHFFITKEEAIAYGKL